MTKRLDDPQRADKTSVPTPRVDAVTSRFEDDITVGAEEHLELCRLARQLERELAEATNRLGGLLFSGAIDHVKAGDARKWRDEFAAKYVTRSAGTRIVTDAMVDRFLAWPLPESVCSDLCATMQGYPHRIGTNLLTADEARLMLKHVLEVGIPFGELQECPACGVKFSVAQSARKPISTVPLIRRIQQQRDECADALRRLVAVVESNFPMPAGVHPGSPLDRASKALADVPTYEQQLRNIAEGIGMTYEELCAAADNLKDGATHNPSDRRVTE